MKIKILDNVFCKAEDPKEIKTLLSYKKDHWVQGPWSRKKKTSTAYAIDGRNGNFLAGLLPRLQKYHKDIEIIGEFNKSKFKKEISLPNGVPRDYQLPLINIPLSIGRGVIQAPTGTGKTFIAVAISSVIKGKILFLCDNIDLLKQTADEYRKQRFKVMEIGGGKKFDEELLNLSNIVISTIQSFNKIDPSIVVDIFSAVFVDECHACNSTTSVYGKVLQRLNCYHKFGLTATPPKDRKSILALEGLIGPIIAKYDIKQGMKQGAMAKPKVTFVQVKYNKDLSDLKKYKEIYDKCIVNNNFRNTTIVKEADKRSKQDESILIIVREIEHGDNLLKIAKRRKVNLKFINGNTHGETRELVKNTLNKKKTKIVVCTDIWTQGVDIPELNCVLNARGGKSRREVLQFAGRGTRATKRKKTLEIIELLDPYKYLSQHLVIRLNIYAEEGWL